MIKGELVQLKDIVTILGDGLHGTPKYCDNGDYYFINGNNLKNGHIKINNKTKRTDYQQFQKYRKDLNDRTIFVSINGTLGNIAIYNGEKCVLGKSACYFNLVESVSKVFMIYLLSDKDFQRYLQNYATGATIKNVSLKSMREYQFFLPSLDYQQKIASILSAYDNLIENNTKRIEILEEMAQRIYKEWFVDFRYPGHVDDELVESELGLIPEGWEVKKLGECDLEIESGRRPKGGIDRKLKKGIPSVGAESVASTGNFDFSKVKYINKDFASKSKKGWVQDMDVALYKDGGKPGLFIPRVALYGKSFPFKNFMINEHIFLLRSKKLGQFFLYGLINSDNIIKQLVTKGSAKAAQPGLNQTEVKDSKFVLPNINLIKKYTDAVSCMFEKQLLHGRQIENLRQTRDLLLPKLISGKLDVSQLDIDLGADA